MPPHPCAMCGETSGGAGDGSGAEAAVPPEQPQPRRQPVTQHQPAGPAAAVQRPALTAQGWRGWGSPRWRRRVCQGKSGFIFPILSEAGVRSNRSISSFVTCDSSARGPGGMRSTATRCWRCAGPKIWDLPSGVCALSTTTADSVRIIECSGGKGRLIFLYSAPRLALHLWGGARTFGNPLNPSAYWQRNFYVTFEDGPIGIRTCDFIGTNILLVRQRLPTRRFGLAAFAASPEHDSCRTACRNSTMR